MIQLTATLMPGCTAKLELPSVKEAARYIWDHRTQAESWEILPDEAEAEILREIAFLRGDAL